MSLTGSAAEVSNLSALCGKINRVSPYSIDQSLTQEGAAAEAKATGIAIEGAKASVNSHVLSKANPHGVTKAQIGLGDVDNTSDIEKPVSNLQKAALDKKVDKETNKQLSTNDFTDAYREKLDGIEAGATKFDFDSSFVDGVVTTEKVAEKSITTEKVAEESRTQYFDMTLAADGWKGVAPWTQNIEVADLPAGAAVTLALDSSASGDEVNAAYGALDHTVAAGALTFKTYVETKVDIPITITFTKTDATEATTVSKTLEATDWIGSAPYKQEIAKDGILATDRPKVYFAPPTEFTALDDKQEAFSMLYDVEADEGTVTFYAKEKPELEFGVTLEVSRI